MYTHRNVGNITVWRPKYVTHTSPDSDRPFDIFLNDPNDETRNVVLRLSKDELLDLKRDCDSLLEKDITNGK